MSDYNPIYRILVCSCEDMTEAKRNKLCQINAVKHDVCLPQSREKFMKYLKSTSDYHYDITTEDVAYTVDLQKARSIVESNSEDINEYGTYPYALIIHTKDAEILTHSLQTIELYKYNEDKDEYELELITHSIIEDMNYTENYKQYCLLCKGRSCLAVSLENYNKNRGENTDGGE
jgi:hypothetical protein